MTARSGPAAARDRAIHESRIQRVHCLIAESQPIETARFEVFDEDVRVREKFSEVLGVSRCFQIETEAPLAAVHAEKVRAPVGDLRRPPARIISERWLFDLDHV